LQALRGKGKFEMTIAEKIAHLQGLAEGLDIQNEDSKEARLLTAMLDVLQGIGDQLAALEDNVDLVNEELDELSDELMAVEEDLYLDDEEDDEEDYEEEENLDDLDDEDDGVYYIVECPECGEQMTLDEDALLKGNIRCEACGQLFSLEIVDEDEEDGDFEEDFEEE
jgi:formylmethanofuran dehydrogenase subunit E